MCDKCKDIVLRGNFYTPQDYINCLEYIAGLIASKQFKTVEQTCPLDAIKDENGYWVDDIIYHKIACAECGQMYTATGNTYRGGGGFRKG